MTKLYQVLKRSSEKNNLRITGLGPFNKIIGPNYHISDNELCQFSLENPGCLDRLWPGPGFLFSWPQAQPCFSERLSTWPPPCPGPGKDRVLGGDGLAGHSSGRSRRAPRQIRVRPGPGYTWGSGYIRETVATIKCQNIR